MGYHPWFLPFLKRGLVLVRFLGSNHGFGLKWTHLGIDLTPESHKMLQNELLHAPGDRHKIRFPDLGDHLSDFRANTMKNCMILIMREPGTLNWILDSQPEEF